MKNKKDKLLLQQHEQQVSEEQEPVMLDDAWQNLAQDWQAMPTASTDIEALIARTRRRVRNAKICYGLNLVATFGLMIAFFYGVYKGQWGQPLNVYLGFGTLISIVFVIWESKVRLTTWQNLSENPDKAVENAIASSKASMQYMLISKLSFLPLMPLLNWYVYSIGKTSEQNTLIGYLMANGSMLALYVFVEYCYQKRKKEYQQLIEKYSTLKSE